MSLQHKNLHYFLHTHEMFLARIIFPFIQKIKQAKPKNEKKEENLPDHMHLFLSGRDY